MDGEFQEKSIALEAGQLLSVAGAHKVSSRI